MNHSIMARVFNKLARVAGVSLLATSTFAQAQTLDFASVFPESDFSSLMVKHWTEGVTKATDGRIKFRIHWSGSLVGNKMVDALRDGVVDAALPFTAYVSGEVVDLAALDVPFSFPLDAKGLTAFNKEVLPMVDAIYEKRGSRAVSAPPALLPDPITCRDRFLSGPEQWKGVKIRTAGRWQAEAVKRFGGSPVVFAPSDLYTALDLGTVNCTLMVYSGILSLKLFEPAKFITRVDHSIAFASINISNDRWKKLSPADRAIMLKVGAETMEWGAQEYTRGYTQTMQTLADRGAKFCVPKQQEFDRLVAAANDVFEKEISPKTSPDGARIVELIKRYRPQVLARPVLGDLSECP